VCSSDVKSPSAAAKSKTALERAVIRLLSAGTTGKMGKAG
jgi:hypothetical protein